MADIIELLERRDEAALELLRASYGEYCHPIMDAILNQKYQLAQEHGYGLMNIQQVLKERHAEYSFDYRDGWFRFAAEIPE